MSPAVAFNLLRWVPQHVKEPLLLISGALSLISLGVLLLLGRFTGWKRAGLVLVLAGAVGNYTDRLVRGYVVDFIHVTQESAGPLAGSWLAARADEEV